MKRKDFKFKHTLKFVFDKDVFSNEEVKEIILSYINNILVKDIDDLVNEYRLNPNRKNIELKYFQL